MSSLDRDAYSSGLSAKQIYDAMKGTLAQGTHSLDAASEAANMVRGEHDAVERRIRSAVDRMAGAWQGSASEFAQSGARPLITSLQKSQDDLAKAQQLITTHSEAFHEAYASLVPVPKKPSETLMHHISPFHSDLDNEINAWNDAQRTNIGVYNKYSDQANHNGAAMPSSYGDVSLGGGAPGVRVTPGANGGRGGHVPAGGVGDGSQYDHLDLPTGSPSTTAQGWQAEGLSAQGGYGGVGDFGQSGSLSSAGGSGGSGGMPAFGAGAAGGFGGGAGSASGARGGPGGGFGAGSSAGSSGAGSAGRAGAAGAGGAAGGPMGGAAGGGKKKGEEDAEHTSAAYLQDDYSSEIVGELPPTTQPVIGG